ncbi:hypothetical protein ABZ942_18140 [Nocardia sp. NPDC046473]|uniref:hypothetical protein n=1 Tax=Nocardia sp. NPDC046473 TaxID=3155733 RepID=UPI0033EE7356
MNEDEFARYVELYNSGNYRDVVDGYYHENVRIDIYGVNFTRGASDTLHWLQNTHVGLLEIMIVDGLRVSANGRDIYARVRETLVALETVKRLASGPLVPGQVRTTSFAAHYVVVDGKFTHVTLDVPRSPLPQADRPNGVPARARDVRPAPVVTPIIGCDDERLMPGPDQWITGTQPERSYLN